MRIVRIGEVYFDAEKVSAIETLKDGKQRLHLEGTVIDVSVYEWFLLHLLGWREWRESPEDAHVEGGVQGPCVSIRLCREVDHDHVEDEPYTCPGCKKPSIPDLPVVP